MKILLILTLSGIFILPVTLKSQDKLFQYKILDAYYTDAVSNFIILWTTDSCIKNGYIEMLPVENANMESSHKIMLKAATKQGNDRSRHFVEVQNLLPGTKYQYRIGNGDQWGEWRYYHTASEGASFPPSEMPDRIILTWDDNPSTTMVVSWRTCIGVSRAMAEIALSADTIVMYDSGDPLRFDLHPGAETVQGETHFLLTDVRANYHHVKFTGLHPGATYVYRVGDGITWSEWFQFKTAADDDRSFSFIYFGDIQNGIRSMVSRVQRRAVLNHPDVSFKIYAGDLVNRTTDYSWGEWVYTLSWAHSMIPTVPVPGNHEYVSNIFTGRYEYLTPYWEHLFVLPDNGPAGSEESVYYFDYQNLRVISLNSTELMFFPEKSGNQIDWLETILADNSQTWTIATLHHPVWSYYPDVPYANTLKPLIELFEKYKVDLVLQGHFHYYSRGNRIQKSEIGVTLDQTYPVYVTSTATTRTGDQYSANEDQWMDKTGLHYQLYQHITIDGIKLKYKSFTATGKLFDSFELSK